MMREAKRRVLRRGMVAALGLTMLAGPAPAAPAAPAAPKQAAAPGWSYGETKDEMRGTVIRSAAVASPTRLDFAFPYDGGSTATLWLIQAPNRPISVVVTVDKGHFECGPLGRIAVKIDQGEVSSEPCYFGIPGRMNRLSLLYSTTLFDRLRGASRLMVEAGFYGEGKRQFSFDLSGLDPGKIAP